MCANMCGSRTKKHRVNDMCACVCFCLFVRISFSGHSAMCAIQSLKIECGRYKLAHKTNESLCEPIDSVARITVSFFMFVRERFTLVTSTVDYLSKSKNLIQFTLWTNLFERHTRGTHDRFLFWWKIYEMSTCNNGTISYQLDLGCSIVNSN